MKNLFTKIICIISFCIAVFDLTAQASGKIYDRQTLQPLIGATIVIKNTNQGTTSDENGFYSIEVKPGDFLQVSYVGYEAQEKELVSTTTKFDFKLAEDQNTLDEIIITGTFEPTKRIETSVATTTLETKLIDKIVSNSAAEILRMIPGVFVQSARGENNNQVFSRGMVFDGNVNFVGFQEDGLPVVSGQSNLNASAFIRMDQTLGKIEAVRGGSASILGASAPGGIFNYISKTGGDQLESAFFTRLGLEGNGRNPYYRLEANIGGPLSRDKSWTFNIGGHYRQADGAKYPGYPLSHGGQLKGNILKKYTTGSFKFYIKLLDDHTQDFEFTPTNGFDDPHPASGFTNSSSVLIEKIKKTFPSTGSGIRSVTFDSKALNRLKDYAAGLHWEHRLTDAWKMTQSFKLSQKRNDESGTFIVYPSDVTAFLFSAVFELIGKQGDYKFVNPSNNQVFGTMTQDFSKASPFSFSGKFPGSDVLKNGVFFTPLNHQESKINDIFYQHTISKVWQNMKLTGGFYSNRSHLDLYQAQAGTSFSTIEDRPQKIAIEYIPLFGGAAQQITDKEGISLYHVSPTVANTNNTITWNNSLYFGHQWNIVPKLTLDWGARYEWLYIKNSYSISTPYQLSTTGGSDNNALTVYDNYTSSLPSPTSYTKNIGTGSYSAGLNYKQNNNMAYYVRFSSGNKVPSLRTYFANQTFAASELPQKTIQLEGGIKFQSKKIILAATPFISILSNIPYNSFASDTNNTFYNLPVLYNRAHASGIELETNIQISKQWSIRANGVIQNFVSDKYQTWDVGSFGKKDDKLVDRSGQNLSFFAAPYIVNLTPTYQFQKGYASINIYTLSKRSANFQEAFTLPAFSQFDLNLGYTVSDKIHVKFSINNLFNTFGIVDWTAPVAAGQVFFDTFNTSAVTKETIKANPQAPYFTMGIQPRAFFLNISVKL